MDLFVYFPPNLGIDRDYVEESIQSVLGDIGEVTGGGAGQSGSNVDIEVFQDIDIDRAIALVSKLLISINAPGETLIVRGDTKQARLLRDL